MPAAPPARQGRAELIVLLNESSAADEAWLLLAPVASCLQHRCCFQLFPAVKKTPSDTIRDNCQPAAEVSSDGFSPSKKAHRVY